MKQFFFAMLAGALFVTGSATVCLADASPAPSVSPMMTQAPQPAPAAPTANPVPPMDFGSPPSGEVPILFNDHHVYANPDTLRHGRVLAALVKNGTLMVPLRSMFEQMGATVSYDGASKSVKASKPGSDVQVTLGKNQVLINGESRPLDVPPMMYKGVVLVPVRVISEALGAYVQWVPEQHVAVVRYIPPTPVPTPPPTPVPTPAPSPTPTPTPAPIGFIQGGIASTMIANAYSPNQHSSSGPFVGEVGLFFGPVTLIGTGRSDQFRSTRNFQDPSGNPQTQFNTIDNGVASTPVFQGRQWNYEGRAEYEILKPRINIGGSFLTAYTNYGDARLTGGGIGIEKTPDPVGIFGFYGSFFYFPVMQGTYMETAGPNNGTSYKQEYQMLKYDIGVTYGPSKIYVIGGYAGDRYTVKQNAAIGQTHSGPYIGLGYRF